MATMKNNLILSSVEGVSAAAILLLMLVAAGQIELSRLVDDPGRLYIGSALSAAGLLAALVVRFRRAILTLLRWALAAIGAAHLIRRSC